MNRTKQIITKTEAVASNGMVTAGALSSGVNLAPSDVKRRMDSAWVINVPGPDA